MPRVIVQRSSGAWWKCILAFLGGAVVGVGGVIGGTAAAGAYMKTGDAMKLAGVDANSFLSPEWQNKSVLDIVLDATGGKIKIETLGDINDITPLVDTYVTNLSDQLNSLGCALTKEEIYSWPLTQLSDHLIESVKKVELISFLSKDKIDNPDPVVKYLCYATDSTGEFIIEDGQYVHHTLADLMDNSSFIQTKVDNMKIKYLFTEADIAASPLLNAIQNKTVKQLGQPDAFDDIKIKDLFKAEEIAASPLLTAIQDKTIKQLSQDDAFDNIKIGDFFKPEDIAASTLLTAIQNKTIKQLSQDGAFNDILIADVIGTSGSESKIIQALKRDNVTVGGISTAINELYLDDVFAYESYAELPSVLKKLLAKDAYGTFPGQQVSGNPYELTRMTLDTDGYPIEYDYVIFSDGTQEHKTDYIPFSTFVKEGGIKVQKGFIDSETITINDDLTATFSGTNVRDQDSKKVSINIVKPAAWENLYAFCCNKPAKVKDLDSAINDLSLKDVMKIKEGDSLWKVRNESILDSDALFDSIKNNLTLQDILPTYNTIKFLKSLQGDTKIVDIGDEVNNLKLIEAFEDNIYDTSDNLDKMWKYLLIEQGETWIPGNPNKSTHPFEGYACAEYTLGGDGVGSNPKGLNQLMTNMQNNMQNAEIRQLHSDGIVTLDSTNFVNKEIPAYYLPAVPASCVTRHAGETTLYFGYLTIQEFSQMVSTYTPALP